GGGVSRDDDAHPGGRPNPPPRRPTVGFGLPAVFGRDVSAVVLTRLPHAPFGPLPAAPGRPPAGGDTPPPPPAVAAPPPRRNDRAADEPHERTPIHSITSSAMLSSDGGIVRSSSRAVWALMTNSNLVDCITGRSAGFAPLRMRPT